MSPWDGTFLFGALAIVSRDRSTGKWEVLLGLKQTARWSERLASAVGLPVGLGRWSMPAGAFNRAVDGTLLRGALREGYEECWAQPAPSGGVSPEGFVAALIDADPQVPRDAVAVVGAPYTYRCPLLWRFDTFLVRLAMRPDPARWPHWNEEFGDMRWFPVDALPDRSHLLVRWAVSAFIDRGELPPA